ncbi:MAG: threonylcarbamoyl-AMP synthase [Nitrospirae bacterium]|nr:MAG: threonylcarbamoyl-AMP synthase [Nitrospirota bacterium]
MAKVLSVGTCDWLSIWDEARECVARGGVLALATESFYALAASATNPEAVVRVAAIKGRSLENPLLVLIGEQSALRGFAADIPPVAALLMERFWPGPLTLVFPAQSGLPAPLTGGTGTVGVRHPGDPHLCLLLQQTGPLTGTSANRAGAPPACTAQVVEQELGNAVDLILDSGPAPGGQPSTVLTIVEGLSIIREGAIPRAEIKKALSAAGMPLLAEGAERPR